MTAPLRPFTAARTNRGRLCVVFVDRISDDVTIMVPIKAIRERDPFIGARTRQFENADLDYREEAEACGCTVADLIGRVA